MMSKLQKYHKTMDNITSKEQVQNQLEMIEKKYSPSTFKFVKAENFSDMLVSFFFTSKNKKNMSDFFLNQKDEIIDKKSIENDFAVISKDLTESFK